MPKIDMPVKRQIKFAVVMYGGGSLAIYINGVAQELLKLAQSTNSHEREFSGTALLYRKIALLLSGRKDDFRAIEKQQKELADLVRSANVSSDFTVIETKKNELKARLKACVPSVEFVIDVLTGSSAGGINAIFLAKALVNGAPNMDDLQKLWLEQGDFAKLLNDRQSVADNGLNAPQSPESLLNSQRMYLELLKAMDGLDAKSNQDAACIKSTNLLDLYVTYTDFEGLPTNLVLSDKTVLERVHKRVFNFRHANGKNDFEDKNNPFLAFAARCTSSFPFAFEPMQLAAIDDVIATAIPRYEDRNSECSDWKQYFNDLTDENEKPIEWEKRWFVDGGCLDNKPFGYAIDRLTQTTGEGIIERKLLYIEPNPEKFRGGLREEKKPNALENIFGQASGLPSYETIREDLQRVLDRNLLIERVARLTAEVEGDFDRNAAWLTNKRPDKYIDWSVVDLNDVAEQKGPAFIPYYRLRVSATTDDIARLVTKYFKIDDNSDYFNALRILVRAWREKKYTEYRSNGKGTFNEFLYTYDLDYRLRRLRFILQKTECLLHCKDYITTSLHDFAEHYDEKVESHSERDQAASKVLDAKEGVLSPEAALFEAIPGRENSRGNASRPDRRNFASMFDTEKFVEAVIKLQGEFNRIYSQLRKEIEFLRQNVGRHDLDRHGLSLGDDAEVNELASLQKKLSAVKNAVEALESEEEKKEPDSGRRPGWLSPLQSILSSPSLQNKHGFIGPPKFDSETVLREAYPTGNIESLINALVDAGDVLDKQIVNKEGAFLRRASLEAKELLGIETAPKQNGPGSPNKDRTRTDFFDDICEEEKFVRNYLRNYYELFDSYDQISYPLFFDSPVGETVKVDVVRVSSRDAHSLIDEENPDEKRRKLAGDYLFAFGAFLDPRWRLNDIMWGRLDGAERLITTLLSSPEFDIERPALIEEANRTILSELLLKNATGDFQATVVEALTLVSIDASQRGAVDKLVLGLTTPAIESGLTSALVNTMHENNICTEVQERYEVNRRLEPEPTLKMISRSTQIIGRILEDITEDQVKMGNRLAWIAKLGQIFWGLITVATTNSIWNSLFNYWIQLVYLFEVLIIVGSTVFAKSQIQQFGIIALIITLGIHLTVMSVQEVMLGDNFWKTLLRTLVGGVLGIFLIVGILFFYGAFFDDKIWNAFNILRSVVLGFQIEGLRRILPLVPFGFLFVLLALWRQAQKLNVPVIGRAIILGFISIAGLSYYFSRVTGADAQQPAPMIALEFVSDGAALGAFAKSPHLGGLINALWVDTFAFIPLYWAFLLILCAVLNRRRQKNAKIAAIIAVFTSSAAAIADIVENYYSLLGLGENGATDQIARNIHAASEIKWTLVFVTLGILAFIFLRLKFGLLWNVVAVLMTAGAIAGIVGAFTFQSGVPGLATITIALLFEFVILFAIGILFQIPPLLRNFKRGY